MKESKQLTGSKAVTNATNATNATEVILAPVPMRSLSEWVGNRSPMIDKLEPGLVRNLFK